jgi:hypothetical protein
MLYKDGARKRRPRRVRAPSFGVFVLVFVLVTFLHRPAYEAWSFAKIYWLRLAHPTARPAVCGPSAEPAGERRHLGAPLRSRSPGATQWT